VIITFQAVTKQFGASTIALDAVSLAVAEGELVVITGPSGSGKTSLMRLLIHEYTPESGEIFFQDESLADLRSKDVPYHRRNIGVVFQDYKLLPELNVWENVALPLSIIGKDQDETESRVTDLLKLVGLTDKANLFPSQLSGGEAQRISIARALATGPKVIFADEPTGNLDPEASLDIVRLLRQINRLGTTILLATHDAVVLEFLKSERRISLDHGKLVKDTRPQPVAAPVVTETEEVAEGEEEELKVPKEKLAALAENDEPEDEIDELDTSVETLDDTEKAPAPESKPTKHKSKPKLPTTAKKTKKA
jgi:cell division transport system ATP-binding protein